MPSSLTVNHPSALVYSTRPRVSVYGTGTSPLMLSGFSREYGYLRYSSSQKGVRYFQVRLSVWICLHRSAPTPFNEHPSARGSVTAPSPRCAGGSNVILNVSAIGLSVRMSLRTRLTLSRLALLRKPWSFGEGAFNPLYRYLFLHLLFLTLQSTSRCAFDADRNAPLPILTYPTASVPDFTPDYYPCAVPRLVSCYALFE